MWHEIWHAVKDSLIILPALLITYLVIELIELKSAKSLQNSKFLKGKFAPLIGGAVGLVPQCGFSVVATDLYTKKAISAGTLMAVYVATSDEAIPLLITSEIGIKNLWIVLLVKFVMALILGYGTTLVVKYFYKPKNIYTSSIVKENYIGLGKIETKKQNVEKRYLVAEINLNSEIIEEERSHKGCCGHAIENENQKLSFWKFVYHPLIHCLKIFAFILVVNIIFALIIHFVGEDNLYNFMDKSKYVQPLIAGLVGLIPNCASSVVITRLFINGGLNLGALITGLSVNAGISYALLIKQNVNRKHTFYIILTVFVFALIVGTIITFF